MTDFHPAVIGRELDALAELFEAWANESFTDDAGEELDVELLRQRLDHFAGMANKALPRIEWILLNAGDRLSPEHRNSFSEMRGQLCQIFNWQEALQ